MNSGDHMNELKLSKRLEVVAGFIPKGSKFADIGSDHAYLPCYAILKGQASLAIAGEITDGPFESAKNQVQKSDLLEYISVRKGDGLSVIKEGEKVDCVTIAGMGGSLITKILNDGQAKLDHASRLILQPNIHAKHIRQWLIENSWSLIEEEIIEEDDKIYEILVAEKGNPKDAYNDIEFELGLLVGPILAKKKSEVFVKKWTQEYNHWRTILTQLENAGHTYEENEKYRDVQDNMCLLEGVLKDEKS